MAIGHLDHIEHLRREGPAFVDAVRAGPHHAVASCPGWTILDLGRHMGMLYRWYVAILRDAAMERPAFPDADLSPDRLAEWVDEGLSESLASLSSTDPDTPVWTLAGPGRARFWSRRAAHETAVHRWDAEGAVTAPAPINAELAVDGIAEFLSVLAPARPAADAPPMAGQTLAVEPRGGPRWVVALGPGGVAAQHDRGPADAVVSGEPSDLLLFLWGRRAGPTPITGDPRILDLWAGAVRR